MRDSISAIGFRRVIGILMVGLFILTACQSVNPSLNIQSPSPFHSVTQALLTPYRTPTASQTPLPSKPATLTPFPTPTATPRSHIVKKGEDMYGIAFQYGITLQELQAANPDVDPNFLSVDMTLLIPAPAKPLLTPGTLPTPTPVGALPGSTQCYRTGEGGLWCFTSIQNQSNGYIEGVTLQVRLGSEGVQVAEGSALTIIDLVPPGASIPAAVYFPPFVPDSYEVDVILETSLPVANMSKRYISSHVENLDIQIAPDGKSAHVKGQLILDKAKTPTRVKVAAVAYNDKGDIIGFRSLEKEQPTVPVSFSLRVYSLEGKVDHISVFAEAIR